MAGSYRGIVDANNNFVGVDNIDNLSDAYEALEECYLMIEHLTGGNKTKIFEAWRHGYFNRVCPPSNNPGTSEDFWSV